MACITYLCDCTGQYVVTCIGNPSYTPGGNPNNTNAPGSAANNPSFISGITGLATKAFAGIAAQAELSAQQTIARKTNTTSITGAAASSFWILLVGAVALFLVLRAS